MLSAPGAHQGGAVASRESLDYLRSLSGQAAELARLEAQQKDCEGTAVESPLSDR